MLFIKLNLFNLLGGDIFLKNILILRGDLKTNQTLSLKNINMVMDQQGVTVPSLVQISSLVIWRSCHLNVFSGLVKILIFKTVIVTILLSTFKL